MTDILLDTNNDLLIVDNDFVIGESSGQHQGLLLIIEKGQIKEKPDATVGIVDYINDNEIEDMKFEIRKKFEADGMDFKGIDYNEITGDLTYDANYKN
jgi:hypothetical protein